jgi:hypothetical protein
MGPWNTNTTTSGGHFSPRFGARPEGPEKKFRDLYTLLPFEEKREHDRISVIFVSAAALDGWAGFGPLYAPPVFPFQFLARPPLGCC